MKKLCAVMIAVFLLALTTVVLAAPTEQTPSSMTPAMHAGFKGPHRGGSFHHGFLSYLKLSKEQMAKMQELRTRYYNETRDMRYELAQRRLEMRKLFTDPNTNDPTLLAKEKELNALRQKLMDTMAGIKIEARRIFTPEQLEKLDTLSMCRHHGHHHWK